MFWVPGEKDMQKTAEQNYFTILFIQIVKYLEQDEISCKFKVSTFCYKNIPEINNPTALNISTMFILCSLNVNIFQTVTKDISNARNNH